MLPNEKKICWCDDVYRRPFPSDGEAVFFMLRLREPLSVPVTILGSGFVTITNLIISFVII